MRMAVRRPNEYACFRWGDLASPAILVAGHRHTRGERGDTQRCMPHYLFHYLIEGSGTVRFCANRQQSVSAGDWFFGFPGQSFSYGQNREDPWLYYWIGFQGEAVDTVLARGGILPQTGVLRGDPDEQTERRLAALLHALEVRTPVSDLQATGLLLELLCEFIERVPRSSGIEFRTQASSLQARVDQACMFMTEHYAEGISVNDVCDHSGFERSYFSKAFAGATGTTIREYLASHRQKKAQELLEQGTLTIAQVAYAIGFAESRTFSHFFRKRTGLSPKHWRQARAQTSRIEWGASA